MLLETGYVPQRPLEFRALPSHAAWGILHSKRVAPKALSWEGVSPADARSINGMTTRLRPHVRPCYAVQVQPSVLHVACHQRV